MHASLETIRKVSISKRKISFFYCIFLFLYLKERKTEGRGNLVRLITTFPLLIITYCSRKRMEEKKQTTNKRKLETDSLRVLQHVAEKC